MFLLNIKRWPFWAALLPGLVSGLLLLLAFPPFDAWGWRFAFLAPLPLVVVAGLTRAPFRSGLGAMLGGVLFWGWQQWWVIDVSAAGIIPMVLYLALYPGLFVLIVGRAARLGWAPLWLVAPIVWVGLEVLRGEVVWNGYPWYFIAHPTIHWLGLASLASVGGVYLVSFIVATPACVVAELIVGRARASDRAEAGDTVWAGLLLSIAVLAWCASPWSVDALRAQEPVIGDGPVLEPPVRFGVVQTSVGQDNKVGWTPAQRVEDFGRFVELTRLAASVEPPPDVIVWPETMFPGYSLSPDAVAEERAAGIGFPELRLSATFFNDGLMQLQSELGIPMIVGAIGVDGFSIDIDAEGRIRAFESEGEYNSAFLVADGSAGTPRYDKIHLTPFGEVMPYISAWPALEAALLDIGAGGMAFNLGAGSEPVRLDVPLDAGARTVSVATPICFEISNSGVIRRLVFDGRDRRAGVIVQLTNDGWFGDDRGGRAAHLMIARWRAIELATPIVRAANTGISAAIDASGRMVRQWAIPAEPGAEVGLGSNPAGVMHATITPSGPRDTTLFLIVGNWPGWAALGLTGLLALASLVAGRPRNARTTEADERTTGGTGSSAGARGADEESGRAARADRKG